MADVEQGREYRKPVEVVSVDSDELTSASNVPEGDCGAAALSRDGELTNALMDASPAAPSKGAACDAPHNGGHWMAPPRGTKDKKLCNCRRALPSTAPHRLCCVNSSASAGYAICADKTGCGHGRLDRRNVPSESDDCDAAAVTLIAADGQMVS